MAYVKGPLMSQSASGQIAKQIIFQSYNGRTYVKKYAVPGNTPGFGKPNQTPAQLAIQALTKSLMQAWKTIDPADQATWDVLSEPKRISRVNAYLKYNYARNAISMPTTDIYPPRWMTCIYDGGTITPNLANWTTNYSSGGSLIVIGNKLWSTADATILNGMGDSLLDGTWNFTGLASLTSLIIGGIGLTVAPILDGLTALDYLEISNSRWSSPPVLTGLSSLREVHFYDSTCSTPPNFAGLTAIRKIYICNSSLDEIDSIFIAVAASADLAGNGTISTTGGNSPGPTSASVDARTALTDNGGNWSLYYN